jgi:hypothetical protein
MPTAKFPIPERACNLMSAANPKVHLVDLGKRIGAVVKYFILRSLIGITAAFFSTVSMAQTTYQTGCFVIGQVATAAGSNMYFPLSRGRNSMTLRKIRASWPLVVSLCIVALAGLPANRSVAAGLVNNATIVNVQPTAQGNSLGQVGAFFVYVNVAPTGGASCATYGQTSQRFVVNPNTAIGTALIATILTAWSTGHNVQINGSGLCDIWGDTESIASIYTE